MTEQRFIDNGDGTVTDTWTKLMWMQEDSFLMTKKFLVYLHAQRLRDKLNSESFAALEPCNIVVVALASKILSLFIS